MRSTASVSRSRGSNRSPMSSSRSSTRAWGLRAQSLKPSAASGSDALAIWGSPRRICRPWPRRPRSISVAFSITCATHGRSTHELRRSRRWPANDFANRVKPLTHSATPNDQLPQRRSRCPLQRVVRRQLLAGSPQVLAHLRRSSVSDFARSGRTKDVLVQERIAEFALWIVVPKQLLKVRQLRVKRLQSRWWHGKQLAPMWAGIKRRELLFDHR